VAPPFLNMSYNYVAPAVRADGSQAILKLGVPHPELSSEIAALRHYDGHGCARLLEADPERGALLIERLLPGNMLLDLTDDEEATRIAFGELETFAATRVRKQGNQRDRITGNLVAAQFVHSSSRKLDPLLHTHCTVFNATFDAFGYSGRIDDSDGDVDDDQGVDLIRCQHGGYCVGILLRRSGRNEIDGIGPRGG